MSYSTQYINLQSVFNYNFDLSMEKMLAHFKDGIASINYDSIDGHRFYNYDSLEIHVYDGLEYSDYKGTPIEVTNIESFLEQLPYKDCGYVVDIYGSHGYRGLGFIVYSEEDSYENSSYIMDTLAALEDGCIYLDEDKATELEYERYLDYWESSGQYDFISHLKRYIKEVRCNDALIEYLENIPLDEIMEFYSDNSNVLYDVYGQDVQPNFDSLSLDYEDILDWIVTRERARLEKIKANRAYLYYKTQNSIMYLFNKYRVQIIKALNFLQFGKQLSLDLE